MTYHSPLLVSTPARPSVRIAVLRCHEDFTMNPEPLVALFADLSDHEAEDIVCRALEDIAARLDDLQTARSAGALESIAKTAKRIAAIADQIGLTNVSGGARHIAVAAEMRCDVALCATLARLERNFDAAVSHVWDFRLYA